MSDPPRILAAAGATGLIGRYLTAAALERGFHVRLLSRDPQSQADGNARISLFAWDPAAAARGDSAAVAAVKQALDGAHWVVNLAGASLAEGRLTDARRARVLSSRVEATTALVRGFQRCSMPPSFWFQASAVGYYGATGEAVVAEDAAPGQDFLADVCVAWEGAAHRVAKPVEAGAPEARLAIGRIGLVLAPDAPAWQKLLKPIRLGAGGRLGPGDQWWSWIDAVDLARAVLFLAEHADASGAFNLTAPHPVRQIDITRQIAQRLKRPSFFPAPKFMLRLVLGELADLLLLASCKAIPRHLEALGFAFERGDLDAVLDHLLLRH